MALGGAIAIAARRSAKRTIDLLIETKSRPETGRLALARRLLVNCL
jgi:hypothetical protein